jgi:negative regulator of flagellin synthesis FlgM
LPIAPIIVSDTYIRQVVDYESRYIKQVAELYANTNTKKVIKAPESKDISDKFELSPIGKALQIAKKAVSDAPDIRQDLVDALSQKIQAGTYYVSDEDLADKLLSAYIA